MTQKKILFILLLAFTFLTAVTSADIPTYEKILQKIESDHISNLSKLKGQIKSKHVHDTQNFAKALREIKNEDFNSALKVLNSIKKNSLLNDYAEYYRAFSLLQTNDYQKALDGLSIAKNPTKKIDLEKFWLRIHLLALTKQISTLQNEISVFKKAHKNDKWVIIKENYYKGLAYLTLGNRELAFQNFKNVLINNPGTDYDQKIFDLLKKHSISKNQILNSYLWDQRAENLIKNGFPHIALKIWQNKYKNNKNYEEKVAYATFSSRLYNESATLYEDLLNNGNYTSSRLDILLKIAQSYARHDNFEGALKYYQKIIDEYPNSKEAQLSKFKLGFTYFDAGEFKKSIEYFEKYLNNGSNTQRDSARWYRLWSFYLTKQYQLADSEISKMLSNRRLKNVDRVALIYWQARIASKLGKNDLAKNLYRKVMTLDGLDYYGLLASQRLNRGNLEDKILINQKNLTMVPYGKNNPQSNHVNLKSLPPDDPIIKAILLDEIGLHNFAFDESKYSSLINSASNYNEAQAFALAGNHNRGYAIRNMAVSGSMPGTSRLDGFRLGFPRAYEVYVNSYAKLWNIDENLAYAIMRQESAFKPEALSYAFAYGLMQIIPPTAEEIAGKINYKDFQISDLNDPSINTLFGTFYLKYLLDEFNNEVVYAIAGYNAGPLAVKRWSAKAHQLEMDEFIELIPYKETNKYVKKVLVNYLVYNKIYP